MTHSSFGSMGLPEPERQPSHTPCASCAMMPAAVFLGPASSVREMTSSAAASVLYSQQFHTSWGSSIRCLGPKSPVSLEQTRILPILVPTISWRNSL
jgi:hypothetical protein